MVIRENVKLGPGGEIVSADITQLKKVTAEQFTQIYLRDNEEFFRLSKAESNVLSLFWLYSTYYDDPSFCFPGNKINFDKTLKEIIVNKTGLADVTVKVAVSTLVLKDMIIKDKSCRGIYYLNPKYFFKGRITDRVSSIKTSIEYKFEK